MMNKKVPRVFCNIWLVPTDPLSSHVRCLCVIRGTVVVRITTSVTTGWKEDLRWMQKKSLLQHSSSPKSNQSEVILADSILNVAPSKMGFHSLQPFLSATSKRPGSRIHHWGSGSNCLSNWNWGRQPDFVGTIFLRPCGGLTLQDACVSSVWHIDKMESEIGSLVTSLRNSTTDLAVSVANTEQLHLES